MAARKSRATPPAEAAPASPIGRSRLSASFRTTGRLTDHSGTTAVGGQSQQVMAANADRKYLFLQNLLGGDLWFNFDVAATIGRPSIQLIAGAIYICEASFVPSGTLNVIGAVAGQDYTAKEG